MATATATKTKLRPLHDRILVKRIEEEEVRRGGIIIPDTAKEKPQEGKVIAVGTGKVTEDGKKIPRLDVEGDLLAVLGHLTGADGKKIPLDVKAGDRILFGKYSGSEVKIDDEEYLILREEDVLGILD